MTQIDVFFALDVLYAIPNGQNHRETPNYSLSYVNKAYFYDNRENKGSPFVRFFAMHPNAPP